MGTNKNDDGDIGTNRTVSEQESAAVWEQLLRLAEGGDIRAIKLYYDLLEKKQRPAAAVDAPPAGQSIEPMAAIRRAVFGDAAVDAAAQCAASYDASSGDVSSRDAAVTASGVRAVGVEPSETEEDELWRD